MQLSSGYPLIDMATGDSCPPKDPRPDVVTRLVERHAWLVSGAGNRCILGSDHGEWR